MVVSNELRLQHQVNISQSQDPFAGTAFSERAFIRVQWPWIAFPAMLLIASLCFFAASVVETRRSGARVWKTGNLVLLAASVDEDARRRIHEAEGSYGQLVRDVGQQRVVLCDKGEEWRFARTQP